MISRRYSPVSYVEFILCFTLASSAKPLLYIEGAFQGFFQVIR
jgi:hypothetical protein